MSRSDDVVVVVVVVVVGRSGPHDPIVEIVALVAGVRVREAGGDVVVAVAFAFALPAGADGGVGAGFHLRANGVARVLVGCGGGGVVIVRAGGGSEWKGGTRLLLLLLFEQVFQVERSWRAWAGGLFLGVVGFEGLADTFEVFKFLGAVEGIV